MTEGLSGPAHAQSFPADISGITPVSGKNTTEKPQPEPSMWSSEPINITNRQPTDESLNGGTRKSRGFFGKFGKRNDDYKDTESSWDKQPLDKQKFTVVGQLKATILRSWINVLLACVPAGFAVNYAQGKSVATFVVNFFAIIPLSILAEYALHEIKLRGGAIAGFLYISL
jgi:Ca2+:H+ antiporter